MTATAESTGPPAFTQATLVEHYASALKLATSASYTALKKEATAVIENPLKHFDFVTNSTLYLTARGLPVNSYSFNGESPHTQFQGSTIALLGVGHLLVVRRAL